MDSWKTLSGRYVLIVDDEPDVLATLSEFLDMCKLDTASSFQEAQKLLEQYRYDIVVLDIMGVDGYGLLKIANSHNIPAVMLTAHALSSDNLIRSAKEGAAYYAPKDEIAQIATFLADVFQAIDEGKNSWERMMTRLNRYFDKQFHGTNWLEQKKEFLDEFVSRATV